MKNLLGKESKGLAAWLVAILAIGGLTTGAGASEADWFTALSDQEASRVYMAPDVEGGAGEPEPAAGMEESSKLIPWLTISVEYALVSDYIWRGINFSEYDGEGREDPNHQLGVDVAVDLAQVTGHEMLGTIGANIWFEWYAGQERIEPNTTSGSNENLQEVDYTLYYTHAFDEVGLTVTGGWIAYHFPRFRDSGLATGAAEGAYTQEVFLTLKWDDSMIFGQPILNPTLSYYLDVDEVDASVILFGISHEFALADYGCKEMPVLKDTTITPSATLMIDHRFYDKYGEGTKAGAQTRAVGTRLGYLEYGLAMSVDLNGALSIPKQYGAFTIGGFLNFVQPFHDESSIVNDQLYGGLKVGWSF